MKTYLSESSKEFYEVKYELFSRNDLKDIEKFIIQSIFDMIDSNAIIFKINSQLVFKILENKEDLYYNMNGNRKDNNCIPLIKYLKSAYTNNLYLYIHNKDEIIKYKVIFEFLPKKCRIYISPYEIIDGNKNKFKKFLEIFDLSRELFYN